MTSEDNVKRIITIIENLEYLSQVNSQAKETLEDLHREYLGLDILDRDKVGDFADKYELRYWKAVNPRRFVSLGDLL